MLHTGLGYRRSYSGIVITCDKGKIAGQEKLSAAGRKKIERILFGLALTIVDSFSFGTNDLTQATYSVTEKMWTENFNRPIRDMKLRQVV